MPHEIRFAGDIFKYPKGINQATLERYVPDIRCRESEARTICIAPPDELATLFIRGVKCTTTQDVMFSLINNQTVGAVCGIDQKTAFSLAQAHRKKYGAPRVDQRTIETMVSDQLIWEFGNEHFIITHWHGKNLQGGAINKYDARVTPLN